MTKYYLNNIEVSQAEAINLIPISITEERVDLREKNPQENISELKQKLKDSDYQAIKYAEGLITYDEYLPIKNQREEYRKKINVYENMLKNS